MGCCDNAYFMLFWQYIRRMGNGKLFSFMDVVLKYR